MKGIFARMEDLAGHVREFVYTQVDLLKLCAAEKISSLLATLIAGRIVAIVFVFFLVFSSIAGAYVLSSWIGVTYSGFLIVAGIYLLTGFVIWIKKERLIRRPVMKSIIKLLFNTQKSHNGD